MKKNSFTLIEVFITIIIITVLAGLSIVSFSTMIENEKKRLCEYNLQTLYNAVVLYSLDHNDALPASLGKLPNMYIDKAVALLEQKGIRPPQQMYTKFIDIISGAKAEAQLADYYGRDMKVLTCPADKTPPPSGISYGIKAEFLGGKMSGLKQLDKVLIADCEHHTFSDDTQAEYRHRLGLLRKRAAIVIRANKDLGFLEKKEIIPKSAAPAQNEVDEAASSDFD